MAPSTSETTEPMTSGPANLVTVVTVTTIFAVLAFVLMVIILYISIRCVARQKHRRQRFHFPPISKAGSSPPPRSDNSSIYSGMSSLGTESTNFNCGSPHPDPFVVKTAAFNPERSTHISNPPPSLITRRQSQVCECVYNECFYVYIQTYYSYLSTSDFLHVNDFYSMIIHTDTCMYYVVNVCQIETF